MSRYLRSLRTLALVARWLGGVEVAAAQPLVLDGPQPTSTGTDGGLCGVAAFAPSLPYVPNMDVAEGLLTRADAITTRFRVPIPDMTNGTARSHGDFAADVPMPFAPLGTPTGTGERLAMRWWGALRVDAPGLYTLAIRSDDGYRVRIGGIVVLEHTQLRVPNVDTRQISFARAGDYAFELSYFENLVDAMVEISLVSGAADEVLESRTLPAGGFALIPTRMLVAPREGCDGELAPDAAVDVDAGIPLPSEAGTSPDGGLLPQVRLRGNGCNVVPTRAPSGPSTLAWLALFTWVATRRRRAGRRALVGAAALALVSAAGVAHAQSIASLDRFVPSTGLTGAPTITGAPEERGVSISFLAEDAVDPLTSTDTNGDRVDLVSNQAVVHVAVEAPIVDGIRVSASLPATVLALGSDDPLVGAGAGTVGLGDLRVGGRARLVRLLPDLTLSASVFLAFPMPASSAWTASTGIGGSGDVALTWTCGPVRSVASVGARHRDGRPIANIVPGPELTAGLAVDVALVRELRVGAELVAATGLTPETFGAESTSAGELTLYGRVIVREGLRVLGAASAGLGRAWGTPELRVILGVGWDFGRQEPEAPASDERDDT